MKKVTLIAIKDALTGYGYMDSEVLSELNREITRGEDAKQAKDALYAQAKDVVLAVMDTPATITEIYEAVQDTLPDGFTKGNLQYAITRLWKDEIDKTEGKVNTYSRKA